MKRTAFPFLLVTLVLASCSKSKQSEVTSASIFFGRWANSYGDTAQFTRLSSGKYVLIYKDSCPNNPSVVEYKIISNKLTLRDDISNPQVYRKVETFKWVQTGRAFEVKAHDWHLCMSNDLKIEFTKLE